MSNFKLAIVAGHYMNTPGKRCLKALDKNETREWWLNDRIVDYIQSGLAAYSGIEIKRLDDPTGKSEITLSERTSAANKWKADFYLSIHHNAGVHCDCRRNGNWHTCRLCLCRSASAAIRIRDCKNNGVLSWQNSDLRSSPDQNSSPQRRQRDRSAKIYGLWQAVGSGSPRCRPFFPDAICRKNAPPAPDACRWNPPADGCGNA